jgi:drug/metabolite transporter (DMT)-like permease
LILSFSGLFLCLDNNLRIFGSDYQIGVLLGILGAFAYSCYLISLKRANLYRNEQTDPFYNLMIVSLIASFILFIVVFIEGNSFAFDNSKNLWLMVAYGTVSHVLGWYFIISGLQRISTVSVGIILISQPVFSFLWDVLLFNRIITQMEIFGIMIVFLAMIICIKSEGQIVNKSGIN